MIRNGHRRRGQPAILLTLAWLLSACAPAEGEVSPVRPPVSPSPVTSPSITPARSVVPAPAAEEPAEISRTVHLYDYYFQPATIEVPRGASVVLSVVNRGNHEHAWVVMEKDFVWEEPFDAEDSGHGLARITVDVIGRDTLVFTAPDEPGEYNIVCSILGHVEYGMVGTLIVR